MAISGDGPAIGPDASLGQFISGQAEACRDYCTLLHDFADNRVELTEFTSRSMDLYIGSVSRLIANAANLGRSFAR